jgi:nucleotide-binding universal stress UspA family protein
MRASAFQLIPEDFEQRIVEDARQRLNALLKRHAPGDLTIQKAVRCGSIYKEILRYARDTQADLVILAAHRPAMRDYLLGRTHRDPIDLPAYPGDRVRVC